MIMRAVSSFVPLLFLSLHVYLCVCVHDADISILTLTHCVRNQRLHALPADDAPRNNTRASERGE